MKIITWSTNKKSKFQILKRIIRIRRRNPNISKENKERKKVNKVELIEATAWRGREGITWVKW